MKRQAGFTLIELLIAVAISALIAVITYQAVNQAVTVKTVTDESVTRFESVQRAVWWMEQDFTQLAPRTVQDELGDAASAFLLTVDYGVEMTRIAVYPSPYGVAGLARVGYVLEGETLYRVAWPVLDRAPDSVAERMPILDKVKRFEIRALNANRQWQTVWPEQEQALTDLPIMTEVVLELDDLGEIRRLFPGVDGLTGAAS